MNFKLIMDFVNGLKAQCEIAGMRPINIEVLMGHSVGISDSYYRATEKELLEDYIKVKDFLTLSNEHQLQQKICKIEEQSRFNYGRLESELRDREREIRSLELKDFSNSEKLFELSEQIKVLKKGN